MIKQNICLYKNQLNEHNKNKPMLQMAKQAKNGQLRIQENKFRPAANCVDIIIICQNV